MVNREIIREIWLRDGYYSEEILTKDELKKYKEECMRLFEEKSESPYKHPTDDSEMLVDLLKHPRVVELVEICMEADLNEDVKVDALQDWMYLKPPGSLGRDVHQDIFYTHANRGEIINTSIHLNSADKDNGGLFFAAERPRHKVKITYQFAISKECISEEQWNNIFKHNKSI